MKLPPHPTAALLEHQPFLRGIPWRQLETLASLAGYLSFTRDEFIFREGDECRAFYLLLSGHVALQYRDVRGHPIVVQILDSGEPMGWSWAFPPGRWSASAHAVADGQAIAFDAVRLRDLCHEDPVLGSCVFRRVAQVLLHRLQATRRRLVTAQHAAAGIPVRLVVVDPSEPQVPPT